MLTPCYQRIDVGVPTGSNLKVRLLSRALPLALVWSLCGPVIAQNIVDNQIVATPAAGGVLAPGPGSIYAAHLLTLPPGSVLVDTVFQVTQQPVIMPDPWPQRATYLVNPPSGPNDPIPWPLFAAATIRAAFHVTDVPPGFSAADMRVYRGELPPVILFPPPPVAAWVEINEPLGSPDHVTTGSWVETQTTELYQQYAALPRLGKFFGGSCYGPNADVKVNLTDWNVLLGAPQGGFDLYTVTIEGVVATQVDLPAHPERFTATLALAEGDHVITAVVVDAANDRSFERTTISIDATGPKVVAELPAEGSTVISAPVVSGKWQEGCAGVNLASVGVTVDGNPCVMSAGQPDAIGFECVPTPGLGAGVHAVVVSAVDNVANVGGRTWNFTVAAPLHLDHFEQPAGTVVTTAKLASVVSLIGDGFDPGATVDLAGLQVAAPVWVSGTRLDVTIPPGARGGFVRVENPDGRVSNSRNLSVVIADGLNDLSGLVLGDDGYIYVANQGTNQILRVSAETGALTVSGSTSKAKGLERDPASAEYYGSNESTSFPATSNRIKTFNNVVVPAVPDSQWSTLPSPPFKVRSGGLGVDPVTFGAAPRVFMANTGNATTFLDGRVVVRHPGAAGPAESYSSPIWVGSSTAHVGMAFDRSGTPGRTSLASVGNLYVTSLGSLLRIPPGGGAAQTVVVSMPGASGLDWQASGARLLVTATQGKLWLVDPAIAAPNNKVVVFSGLSSSRYGRFDTIRRSWDPAPGDAVAPSQPLQAIVAEPTRLLSVRAGVPLRVDSVNGVPTVGPPLVDEFSPVTEDHIAIVVSGEQAATGDQLELKIVRKFDDPQLGEAQGTRVVRDLGTFSIGPASDIVPDAAGNWSHTEIWDGRCGLVDCDDCEGLFTSCPTVTRRDALGRPVKMTLPPIHGTLRSGEYLVQARLMRAGFALGEDSRVLHVPTVVQIVARWNADSDTFGNLHTNLQWLGLADSPGNVPNSAEDAAVRAHVLQRLQALMITTAGLQGLRVRWLPPVDNPAEPLLDDVINIVVGGDKNVDGPNGALCGLNEAGWAAAPGSCVDAYQYHPVHAVRVWPGVLRTGAGNIVQPFPLCGGGCTGVPHIFGQTPASGACDPLPAIWQLEPTDLYFNMAQPFCPTYGGAPIGPGDWPPGAPPTPRQEAVDSLITAFARHVWATCAHELGHALGVPEFERYPNCMGQAAFHNIDVDRTAPVGTPYATRDTQHDLMDSGVNLKHTPDVGLANYVYPGPPAINEANRAGFQDDQCDANDVACPGPAPALPYVHPLSARDLAISNR